MITELDRQISSGVEDSSLGTPEGVTTNVHRHPSSQFFPASFL